MLTRQDHGLAPGEQRTVTARQEEGGLPYALERLHDGTTMLWEGRRLAAPKEALALRGVVDGWWLDVGDLPATSAVQVVQAYRALLDGVADLIRSWRSSATLPARVIFLPLTARQS